MNGAVMDRRQDSVLRPQHRDSSGIHSPGYHLQINQSHQQKSRLQHSKAIHYQSLSDPFLVDGSSEYTQSKNIHRIDEKQEPSSGKLWDPRSHTSHIRNRLPLELPVPKFEIDANYVGEPFIQKENKCNAVENSKALDLDTRIDLLIKSKALAGMHPIFSELNDSEESSFDSDECFISKSNRKDILAKRQKPSLPETSTFCVDSFDDPEKPLSRPPSPFLSRASYLFWFNKAIELKQQAKAQEQALLEKATKRLIHDSVSPTKTSEIDNSNQGEKHLLKTLLHEVSKELKKIAKQEFINEVFENTVFNTFENWWEKQRQLELEQRLVVEHSFQNSVFEDNEDNLKIFSSKDQCKLKENSFNTDLPASSNSFPSTIHNEDLGTTKKLNAIQKHNGDYENSTSTSDIFKKDLMISKKEKHIMSEKNSSSASILYDVPLKKRNVLQVMDLSCHINHGRNSDHISMSPEPLSENEIGSSENKIPGPKILSNVNLIKVETVKNDTLRPSSELSSSECVNSKVNKQDIAEDIYKVVKHDINLLINDVDTPSVENNKTHTCKEFGNETSKQTNSIITVNENESIKFPNFISNVNSNLENYQTSLLPNQEVLVSLERSDSIHKTESQDCLLEKANITVPSVINNSDIEETVNESGLKGAVY